MVTYYLVKTPDLKYELTPIKYQNILFNAGSKEDTDSLIKLLQFMKNKRVNQYQNQKEPRVDIVTIIIGVWVSKVQIN